MNPDAESSSTPPPALQPLPEAAVPTTSPAARPINYASAATTFLPTATETSRPPRQRLWPAVGWQMHMVALLVLCCAVLLAFGNSVTSLVEFNDKYRDIGYTLDNRYIILADPRTKATSWEDPNPAPTPDVVGQTNIFTKDYWWPKGISGLYRPVVTWTYWFTWTVIGGDDSKLDPLLSQADHDRKLDAARHRRFFWFHGVNLISHLITVILVYGVGLLLIKRYWPALALALLFAVHPVTVESVTNVIGRADIFAAIAGLGSLLLYARAAVSRHVWKIPWLIALFLLATFGLFSKESSVTILPMLVVYDLIYRRPEWRGAFVNWKQRFYEFSGWIIRWTYSGYIAVIIPIIGMLTARYFVFEYSTPPEEPFIDNPLRGVNWFAARLSAIQITVRSWKVCFWPVNLTADYSFNQVPPAFSPWSNGANNAFALASLLIVGAVIAIAIWLWKSGRSKPAAYFICFFFITYVLTANLVYTIGAIMAERFLYLPVIGFLGVFVLLIEAGIERVCRRIEVKSEADRPLLNAATLCVIVGSLAILLGIRTSFRNQDWRSDAALWRSAQMIAPNSFRVYQSYAFSLYEELNKPVDQRQPETKDVTIEQVIGVAEKALPILDQLNDRLNSTRLYLHLGMYYGYRAEHLMRVDHGSEVLTPEAIAGFEQAIRILERAVPIDQTFSQGNRQREIQRGRKGADVSDVGLFQIYEYLGNSYLRLNRVDKAIESFYYMRQLNATDGEPYLRLAAAYLVRCGIDQQRSDGEALVADSEQASIALIQSLWLNSNRPQTWQFLQQTLSVQCAPGSPPPIILDHGVPRLNADQPVVRSVICSAYQGLTRTFLQTHLVAYAEMIRASAVRDSHYPQGLFDSIFREFGKEPPPIAAAPTKRPLQQPKTGELRPS